jgi:ribosomal-protein-alanine N-acetyltransferase
VFALLVEGEARLAGMIVCRAVAGEAAVLTVAVDPDARRQGLGRALVEAALGLMRQQGAIEVFLEVAIDNHEALRLYERIGFEQAGLRRGYYDRGGGERVDAAVMRLDLRAL